MGESPSGYETIVIEWTLAAVAFVFVLLRIWARVVKLRSQLIWADLLVLSGWILEVMGSSCDTVVYLGGGMPAINVQALHLTERLLKWSFASSSIFYIGILFPRFSIAAFYFTLFPEGTTLRKALYGVLVYMVLATITIFLLLFCYCTPVSINWSLDPKDTCSVLIDEEPFTLFWVLTLVCDVSLFVLPFFLLRELNLKPSQRFGLIAIFLVGFITIAVSVARYCAIRASPVLTTVCIWSAAEFACSIIVVCLPNLKVFFHGVSNVLRDGNTDDRPRSSNKPSPFSGLFSTRDRDSARENSTTLSTRISSIVDQFVIRQSNPASYSERALEDSPIISSFNKDNGHLFGGKGENSVSNIELSSMDQQQQGRRPSELTILKTNDVHFDVHVHDGNGADGCTHHNGRVGCPQNNNPPCTMVEYVPGGKTPFETKVWV